MQSKSHWKVFYLTYFSSPSSDRIIYRTMLRRQPRRIIELGLGLGQRALRLIDVAASYAPRGEVQYIGIDPFEDRLPADRPGLTLISAHRLLKSSGARIKLIPGNPGEVLIGRANHLGPVDLMIISTDERQADPFGPLWFYIPRLLHEKTAVFRDISTDDGKKVLQEFDHRDILAWAAPRRRRKAA
ncbi:MAG: hypothetical protein JXB10_03385 [Pirellulales bacterium]|nr:hypothetical protein [Pirellulales bacterium]